MESEEITESENPESNRMETKNVDRVEERIEEGISKTWEEFNFGPGVSSVAHLEYDFTHGFARLVSPVQPEELDTLESLLGDMGVDKNVDKKKNIQHETRIRRKQLREKSFKKHITLSMKERRERFHECWKMKGAKYDKRYEDILKELED